MRLQRRKQTRDLSSDGSKPDGRCEILMSQLMAMLCFLQLGLFGRSFQQTSIVVLVVWRSDHWVSRCGLKNAVQVLVFPAPSLTFSPVRSSAVQARL